jgi:signal transduction histidine kinase
MELLHEQLSTHSLNYEDIPVPCCRVDDKGFIVDCNKLFADLLGASTNELFGTPLIDLVDISSYSVIEKILAALRGQSRPITNNDQENILLKRRDCSITLPATLSLKLVQDGSGSTLACNIAILDQTLIHRKIEQAEKDRDDLKRKEKLKDEFIAVASHELRTPIQPMLGYALLAKKGMVTQEKAWDGVLTEARRLQQLVNDILDVSRIESVSLKYNFTKEKINSLLTSIGESVRTELNKDITLSTQYNQDEAGLEIEIDRSRITQVINNLLSNAVKFTEKGSITIQSKAFPAENKIEVKISDTGKGISYEFLPHLFQKFATKGHSNVQNNKGTGLGLYITKAIVKGHNGEIAAFNNEYGGATFLITLPITQTTQDATDAEALNVKGMNLVSNQDLRAALEHFEQAVKLNPNHPKAWYNMGMCLMNLGEAKEEASRCFEKAIEINPLDAESWNNKGAILEMLEDNKEALKCYERSLELRPGYSRAWQNKGGLLQKMGNKKAAKECFRKAVESSLK